MSLVTLAGCSSTSSAPTPGTPGPATCLAHAYSVCDSTKYEYQYDCPPGADIPQNSSEFECSAPISNPDGGAEYCCNYLTPEAGQNCTVDAPDAAVCAVGETSYSCIMPMPDTTFCGQVGSHYCCLPSNPTGCQAVAPQPGCSGDAFTFYCTDGTSPIADAGGLTCSQYFSFSSAYSGYWCCTDPQQPPVTSQSPCDEAGGCDAGAGD